MNDEFGTDASAVDPAWELLRANDPVTASASPDLAAIKASVLAESTKVVPISKRSWLAPVAIAASVALVVGSGAGYTVAARSTSDSSSSIAMPVAEMGVPARGSADEKMSSSAIWGGRPFLEAGSGISNTSGTQVGYTFDASDIDRKKKIQDIAKVFAIDGKVSGSKKDGYFVGDQNYIKALAQISGASWDLSQLITWNYNDSSTNPTYCGQIMPMYDTKSGDADVTEPAEPTVVTETDLVTPEPIATEAPLPTIEPAPIATEVPLPTAEPVPTIEPAPIPAPSECETPAGVLPTDESALAFAQEKFDALGFNQTNSAWSVTDTGGMWGFGPELASAYKLVTAKVLIDGLQSNQSWSMTIGPDNSILSANGFFAKFVPTSGYEIVGAKTAIERSQSGLWMNLPPQEIYRENMVYPMEMPITTNPSAVKRNSAGQPILDAGLDRVTIKSAEKSLISWYLNDGSTILLPAYLLSEGSDETSRQWLQIAIADKYVDFN